MRAAAEAPSVIVVDDFYAHPEAVRRHALSMDYAGEGETGNYPGVESRQAYFTAAHIEAFRRITGRPLVYDQDRWVFGKFRIGESGGAVRTSVHLDHVDWSAVVYLSELCSPASGLCVYRHRRLGLDRLPDQAGLAALGCRDRRDFDRRYVRPISTDVTQWEEIDRVDYRFNRLVLLPSGSLFHGIAGLFGSSRDDGRLTHSFFMFDGALPVSPGEVRS